MPQNNLLDNFSTMRLVMLSIVEKQGGEVTITNDDLARIHKLGPNARIEPGVNDNGDATFQVVIEDENGNVKRV